MCVCVCVCVCVRMRGRACLYVRSFVRVCCMVSLIILSREEFVVFTGMFVLRAVGEGVPGRTHPTKTRNPHGQYRGCGQSGERANC